MTTKGDGMNRMFRKFAGWLGAGLVVFSLGCTSSSSSPSEPKFYTDISVSDITIPKTIMSGSKTMVCRAVAQGSVKASNGNSPGSPESVPVVWSADQGTIAQDGTFKAPDTQVKVTVTIKAAAQPDTSIFKTVAVTVVPMPNVSNTTLTATPPTVLYKGTSRLHATFPAGATAAITPGIGPLADSPWDGDTLALTSPTAYTLRATSEAGDPFDVTATVAVTQPVIGITPQNPLVKVQQVVNFIGTCTGAVDNTLTWSATAGTINANTGVWTAPAASDTATIRATLKIDPTKYVETQVTIQDFPPPEILSFIAVPDTIDRGGTSNLVGTFTGGTAVIGSGGPDSRDVSTNVLSGQSYPVSPTATTTYTLTVTNPSGVKRSLDATVTVRGINISISGPSPVLIGSSHQYVANVTEVADKSVTWGTSAGTIGQDGMFTAPGVKGNVTLTATLNVDATVKATKVVEVVDPPTIDGSYYVLSGVPTQVSIPHGGGAGSVSFSITRYGGFADPVTLAVDSLPSGFTATPTPGTVNLGTLGGNLPIAADSSVPDGVYTLILRGKCVSQVDQTLAVTVTVGTGTGGGDFVVDATPRVLTINTGAGGSSTALITRHSGFTGAVDLSTDPAPYPGITVTYTPSSVPGSNNNAVINISVGATVKVGAYPILLKGTSGTLVRFASMTIRVNDSLKFGFWANPTQVTAGGSSNLQGYFTGGDGSIDHSIGTVISPINKPTGPLAATTTYTLTVTGPTGDTATAQATVEVVAAPTVLTFTAAPASVNQGGASTLSWTTANVPNGNVSIVNLTTGATVGSGLQANGSISSGALNTVGVNTFRLTATNAIGGTVTATATVTVNAAGFTSFSASAGTYGACQQVSLSWTTSGTITSLVLNQTGTASATYNVFGTNSINLPLGPGAYSFTLTANGSVNSSAVNVTVAAPSAITSFSAAPPVVTSGSPSTLSWTAIGTGLTYSLDQGIGSVGAATNHTVNPVATTTYMLTAQDAYGCTTTSTVTVTVGSAVAITSFTAAPANVTQGGSGTLTWTTVNGTGTSIDNGIGAVAPIAGGSVGTGALGTLGTNTWTLTATGVGGPVTATASINVVAAPVAGSLVASNANPPFGGTFTLTPTYSAGTGAIDHGVVCPATGVASAPVTANWSGPRTYTLTVTNLAGSTATATAVVTPQTVVVGPIAPASPTRTVNTITTFSTTVTGGALNTVTWSASGGSITAGGVWTAPATAGSVTITATSVDDPTKSASTTVTVVAAPNVPGAYYTLGGTPTVLSVVAGGGTSGASALTVTRANGFADPVDLLLDPVAGMTGNFTVNPIPGTGGNTSSFTVTTTGAVADGVYTLTVRGKCISQPDQTLLLTLVVGAGTGAADFRLDATPQVVPVTAGGASNTSTIGITRISGHAANVTFSVVGGPAGISGAFVPNPSGGANSVLTLSATGAVAAGAYPLTVQGTDGTNTRFTTVVLQVSDATSLGFYANPTVVASGGSSTLLGQFTGGTGAIDNGIGAVTSPINSPTGPLVATTTYTLTVTNAAGDSALARATVTVGTGVAITSFTASQAFVTQGGSTTLNWTTVNATGTSIDQGIGAVAPIAGGSVSTGVLNTLGPITYTMTATGVGGPVTATVTVTVVAPPVISTFTAAPNPISVGGSSTLSWTTSGASNASIDQGIGAVAPVAGGSIGTGALVATTTYTITAANAAGNSVTATTTVTVIPPPPAINSFAAAPGSVGSCSTASTLSWNVSGAITSISIDQGVGVVAAVGSTGVSPVATTTYTLTATGPGGTNTATATVTVAAAPAVTSFNAASTSLGSCNTGTNITPVYSGSGATAKIGTTAGGSQISANAPSGIPVASGHLASTSTLFLTVTDSFGCTAASSVVINVAAAPVVTGFTASPASLGVCQVGSSVTLTPTYTGTGATARIGTTLGGSQISANAPSGIGVNSGAISSSATFFLTVTDSFGCTASSTVTVTVDPAPTASLAGPGTVGSCNAGTLITPTFTGVGAVGRIGTTPGGSEVTLSATSGVPFNVGAVPSTTIFYLTVDDVHGCTASAQVTVTVAAAPTVASFSAAPATVTQGQSSTLSWTTTGTGGSVAIQNLTTATSVGSGLAANGSTSSGALNTLGVNTFRLTFTDAYGCQATQTTTVNVVAAPTANLASARSAITAGENVTITPTFTGGTGTIGTTGAGSSDVSASATSGIGILVGPASTTTYTLTVTNAAGTTATSATTITVYPVPTAALVANPATVNLGNTSNLTPTFANSGGAAMIGSTGSGSSDVTAGAVSGTNYPVTPGSTTTYTLTAKNPAPADTGLGVATATATVTVNTLPGPVLGSFGTGTGVLGEMCGGEGTADQYQYNDYIYFTGTFDTATLQNPLGVTVATSLQEGLPNAFLIGTSEHWVPTPGTCGKGCSPILGIGNACTNSEFADFLNDCAYRGTWTLTLVRNSQTSVYTFILGLFGPEGINSGEGWRQNTVGYPLCP